MPEDGNDIIIRALRAEDAAAWRMLRLEGLRDHPRAFVTSYEEVAEDDVDAFAARMPAPTGPDVLFGAFAGDKLVGSAGLLVRKRAKERHKADIVGVYVTPRYRGKGIAHRLIRAALDHARGYVAVVLLVAGAENAAARRLYERCGFVVYGLERRAMRLDGREYDDVYMALHLDQQPDDRTSR